ncbi:hypothetical protein F2Q68_00044322 [Brassica cretica]|uniref:Uncharacterized protein n=1 Tax=Brassica cretica TaxID=69181 RepID=A0A8S9LF66_BRACR|nr:hypothetical protein F2Q68_00044322 [Brassica cretica]
MHVFNSTLDGSFREARLSYFKAEEIERKFIRFQNEVAERERKQAESHSRALIRAERKGRRTIAAEKRSSKKKTSPQSSSGNPCTNEEIIPKEEFEVDQEEKEAYWDALCDSITSPPEVLYPTRPATQLDHTLPSRTSPAYLKTLREFYRVPSGVVFRVPAIVRALDQFELSISQLNVAAFQNFLGVLILSYELGMDLSPDDFEGLWLTRKTSIDNSYRIVPKRHYVDNPGAYFKCQGMVRAFFLCSNRWRIRRGQLSPLVLWQMEL